MTITFLVRLLKRAPIFPTLLKRSLVFVPESRYHPLFLQEIEALDKRGGNRVKSKGRTCLTQFSLLPIELAATIKQSLTEKLFSNPILFGVLFSRGESLFF